jgi:rRNA biogenesis protein RRP5
MNLENLYGTQEALIKVFESALQQNEPIDVYKRLVTIYIQSEKHDLATKLYQTMIRKFAGVHWVWSQYGTFLMKRGKQAQARVLLQKGLKALTSKQDRMLGGREALHDYVGREGGIDL